MYCLFFFVLFRFRSVWCDSGVFSGRTRRRPSPLRRLARRTGGPAVVRRKRLRDRVCPSKNYHRLLSRTQWSFSGILSSFWDIFVDKKLSLSFIDIIDNVCKNLLTVFKTKISFLRRLEFFFWKAVAVSVELTLYAEPPSHRWTIYEKNSTSTKLL